MSASDPSSSMGFLLNALNILNPSQKNSSKISHKFSLNSSESGGNISMSDAKAKEYLDKKVMKNKQNFE